jgi:hypothetical protein
MRLPADADSLRRIATEDEATGALARRREIVGGLNRQLLMAPPADVLAPELFDFVVALAPRMEAGVVSSAWGSYLFTTYQRDLRAERPDGRPRRSPREIDAILDGWIEFYRIQANPRAPRGTSSRKGSKAFASGGTSVGSVADLRAARAGLVDDARHAVTVGHGRAQARRVRRQPALGEAPCWPDRAPSRRACSDRGAPRPTSRRPAARL